MAKAEVEYYTSPEHRREVVSEVIKAMTRGDDLKDIKTDIARRYNLPEEYIKTILFHSARKEIAKITAQQADLIIPSHIMVYEELYKYFDAYSHTAGKMKALKYKEQLMGLRKENRTIEINNKKKTIIEKDFSYDSDKLSPQEQSRLSYLLNKAKK